MEGRKTVSGRRYRWAWMVRQCWPRHTSGARKTKRRLVWAQTTWSWPGDGVRTGLGLHQGSARWRNRRRKKKLCSTLATIPEETEELRIYFFPDLGTACRALSLNQDLVSQRGSSSMYRGTMEQQQAVSVRILSQDLGPEEQEVEAWLSWLKEVRRLSQMQHPNWVKLLAYCLVEKSNHHILVYEALPSMSLQSRLLDRGLAPLPWSARMKIAVGAARSLALLQEQEWCVPDRPKLLCGNLNSHTLLLGRDYSPKLFLVKLSDEWPLRFTLPDYSSPAAREAFRRYLRAQFCHEMDVFNLGLLLIELLAGRARRRGPADWARPCLQGGYKSTKTVSRLVDKRLKGRYCNRAAKEVTTLAFRCISPEDGKRPSMCEIVRILERVENL